jgi:two-component system, OmpR family, response regulator ChvI
MPVCLLAKLGVYIYGLANLKYPCSYFTYFKGSLEHSYIGIHMVITLITNDFKLISKDGRVMFSKEDSKKRILVVDDDPDVAFFFKNVLETNGYDVNAYNDSVKALSEFKPQFYDLLLSDIRMPHLNGFELFKLLRKKDHNIKVCFMTAFESYYNAIIEEHPTLNARCFIRKPIEVKDLLSIIEKELN